MTPTTLESSPLRIAAIVGPFPSSSETFIESQITGLLDRGHEVDVFATHADEGVTSAAIERTGVLDRTTWAPALPRRWARRALSGLRLAARYAPRRRAALAACLDVRRFGRRAARLELLHSVVPMIDGAPYDLVHCHFGSSGAIGQLFKSLGLARHLAVSFYGNDVLRYVSAHGYGCYRDLFDEADLVIALSERMRRQLIGYGSDPERTIVQRLGVDPTAFPFAPRTLGDEETIRITTTARLAPTKGLPDAIEAVAQVHATCPRVRLEIIGEGPMRGELESLIDRLGAGTFVSLTGWLPNDVVAKRLAATHLFLLPSITTYDGDEEGTPTAIIEALASGIPVVSTWHSGIPELVTDRISGLLAPQHRPGHLAECLKTMIASASDWPEMGRAGRATVEAGHDRREINDRLVSHFQRTCGRLPDADVLYRFDDLDVRSRAA